MKSDEKCVEIYPSIWKMLLIILGGMVFVLIGYFMTKDPRSSFELFMVYFCMIFFFLASLVGIQWIILKAIHIPLARIYDDRLEYLIPARMKYEKIPFQEVEVFVIFKMESLKYIQANYLSGARKHTGILNSMVKLDDVCDLLNEKLEQFWADRKKNSEFVYNPVGLCESRFNGSSSI